MSGKHFSSSWLAVDSFTSAPLSITVRYGAVACVKPVGFTRRAASDPIAFPFPLSNGSDQNHKHEPVSGLKSVQKGGGKSELLPQNERWAHSCCLTQLSHPHPAVLLRPVPLRNPKSDFYTKSIVHAPKNASGKTSSGLRGSSVPGLQLQGALI